MLVKPEMMVDNRGPSCAPSSGNDLWCSRFVHLQTLLLWKSPLSMLSDWVSVAISQDMVKCHIWGKEGIMREKIQCELKKRRRKVSDEWTKSLASGSFMTLFLKPPDAETLIQPINWSTNHPFIHRIACYLINFITVQFWESDGWSAS